MKYNKPQQLSVLVNGFILSDVMKLAEYAALNGFNQVEVLPMFVKPLKRTSPLLKVSTPVGYPYGHQVIEAKLSETVLALVDGADEVEWILNVQAIRSGDFQYLAKEITTFLPVAEKLGKLASLGLNVSLLTTEELSVVYNVIGPSAVYSVHIFANNNMQLENKLAQARVLLPDAIKIRVDNVNNNSDFEINHADVISLCITLSDLHEIKSYGF